MANVNFSRKEFEKHIKLTKEIEDKIPMFGTSLEFLNDEGMEIEIMPNRPDLLSMHGFIRGFSGFLGKKTGMIDYKLHEPEKNFEVTIDKSAAKARPFTACAIVKELKFDDAKIKEVIDIQEKLHATIGRNRKKAAIGIYPLEKIKLPIKFEARAPNDIRFVPLEEQSEMTGRQILSGHPAGREYGHLLSEKEKFPVFVDDAGEILSMPPIINSHKTGKITESTKDIFIECSGFDFEILKKTLNILVTMFADMGGKIYQVKLKYKRALGNSETAVTPDLTPDKMRISLENTNKLLGLELGEKEMASCLEKMGYGYSKGEVKIPAWRVDILHENDLIEDIAIAYGYDRIEPEMPSIATAGEENPVEIKKRKIAEILAGMGMLEVSSCHLTTAESQFRNMSIKKENEIEVADSRTEYSLLRQNLLHCALKILSENTSAEYPQKIFELGRIFEIDEKGGTETGIRETERLCIACAGLDTTFTEIKQTAEYLAKMLGRKVRIEPAEHSSFISGRCGKIFIGDEKEAAGHIGEIAPNLLSNLKIRMPVSALEIDIEEFLK